MSADEILAEFKVVLADERDAIRKADAKAVLLTATKKEKLAAELVDCGAWKNPDLLAGLSKLVEELRNNGVLLAHARDCLRDAIAALHGAPSNGLAKRTGLRLSVTG
jgi:hypothetical protein